MSSAVAGFLDRTFLIWAVICVPVSLAGTWFGLVLYRRVNDAGFRRVVLIMLAVSGTVLVISGLQ